MNGTTRAQPLAPNEDRARNEEAQATATSSRACAPALPNEEVNVETPTRTRLIQWGWCQGSPGRAHRFRAAERVSLCGLRAAPGTRPTFDLDGIAFHPCSRCRQIAHRMLDEEAA